MREKHRHQHCVERALERAESHCRDRHVRLTPIRKTVLKLIWQSHKPVKAYDLLAQLSSDEFVEKPPTIYRALQFLLDHHLIHKIESQNAYIGCEAEHEGMDSKFLICDQCHEVEELIEPKLNQTLSEMTHQQGFTPSMVNIEIHGTCAHCAK